jgi:hypothetical protein
MTITADPAAELVEISAGSHYAVSLPEGSSVVTLTLNAEGKPADPTTGDECVCDTDPTRTEFPYAVEKDNPVVTFSGLAQSPFSTTTQKWEIKNNTATGDHAFTVSAEVVQNYHPCPDGWSGGVPDKTLTIPSKNFTVTVIDVSLNMTAYRPLSANPLNNRLVVPQDQNESPGVGIRINGDDDNNNGIPDMNDSGTVGNENDLVEVELEVTFPVPSGVTYVLKRNNVNIEVWENPNKGTSLGRVR